MVNVSYIKWVSRRAMKWGDWKVAVNVISAGLSFEFEGRAKVLIERARICNMQKLYEVSLSDSKEIIVLEPTNYRGYNHAAIAAHGSFHYEKALLFIHTGLEKVTDPLPLVVRLRILLELKEYKDFVQEVSGAETKAKLRAFIADEDNEFLELFEALEKNSDEAFAIFRAVALAVVGKLDEGQEVVNMAELTHPNQPSLIAAKQLLQNPETLIAAMRNDVHFEADETPDSDDEESLLSDPEAKEDSAGEEEENNDSGLVDVEGDDEDENEELVGLDENGDGDQQSGERNDSGLG